ncbi:MAG: GNAT family N-acetyltransferase [Thiolinea sp.]
MDPSADLIIRTAEAADARILADFNLLMAQETEHRELDPGTLLAGVSNLIRHPSRGFYLVAETTHHPDQQIVGSLLITTEWSDWRNGLFWWIQSVFVRNDWRRRGVYRRLYQQVQQLAAEQDSVEICGFRLYVERDNGVAQQTYRQLGMDKTPYRIYETLR